MGRLPIFSLCAAALREFIYSSSRFISLFFFLKPPQHWSNESASALWSCNPTNTGHLKSSHCWQKLHTELFTVTKRRCALLLWITQQGIWQAWWSKSCLKKTKLGWLSKLSFKKGKKMWLHDFDSKISVTYSLLICDVQLWFSVRLELIIIKSCIDPSILHDLLQKQRQTIKTDAGFLRLKLICKRKTNTRWYTCKTETFHQ